MDPIAFGRPAAYQSTSSRAPAAATSAVGRASADEERAEQPALSTDIGALERYAAQTSGAPVPTAPTVPADPTASPDPAMMMPPLQASTGSTGAPFSPARSWSSMVGQNGPGGSPAGSAADQGMSQIIDGGDVFDTSDD